jgi:hypothetical protein
MAFAQRSSNNHRVSQIGTISMNAIEHSRNARAAAFQATRRKTAGEVEPISPQRALVVTAPPTTPEPHGCQSRPSAAFLAQLIATHQQAPQTRERRRAEPAEAIRSYSDTETRTRTNDLCRPL